MKNTTLFTTTGDNYWHFHAIGVGIIFNYHVKSKQVMTTCEFTAQLIEVKDYYKEGGFPTQESFKSACEELYKIMVEDKVCQAIDYMDDPEIIELETEELGEFAIGYDPKVIWN
jgi:3-dehydroquinate synthetase